MVSLIGLAAAWLQPTYAQLLDWNQLDWSRGAESQTFTNVDNSGIDITISLSLSYDSATYRNKSNSYSTTTNWLSQGPDDDSTFGGDGSAQNGQSLYLGLNFASDDRTRSYLDVTISFSQSVQNVSFDLFDVDTYGYNYSGDTKQGSSLSM
jgi:hypothetical protein